MIIILNIFIVFEDDMETSLAEDVKKPTRTLSPDSFFFMSPYRSFTTSGCFRRFHSPPLAAMR